MAPMVTTLPLVFVTVTFWTALVPPVAVLNVRPVPLSERGAFAMPDPLADNATTSGIPPAALCVITMDPLSVAAVGCTCALTVQYFFGAIAAVKQLPVLIT